MLEFYTYGISVEAQCEVYRIRHYLRQDWFPVNLTVAMHCLLLCILTCFHLSVIDLN